jgi:hypothetical protein
LYAFSNLTICFVATSELTLLSSADTSGSSLNIKDALSPHGVKMLKGSNPFLKL